jgi:hypothetical protein
MFERIKALEPIDRLPASLRLLITAGARIDAGTVSWFRRHLDQGAFLLRQQRDRWDRLRRFGVWRALQRLASSADEE